MIDLRRAAVEVAPMLLGATLSTEIDDDRVSIRIVEVEAYEGGEDPASHAYRGERPRHRSMFGPPGHLYVYRHLGLHHCVNVVVGRPGVGAAVLIRAGEVTAGVPTARRRRTAVGVCRRDRDLARGPARLAVALGLGLRHDGAVIGLGEQPGGVWLRTSEGEPPVVERGPRIGIAGAGAEAASWPWRFWIAGSEHVSAGR